MIIWSEFRIRQYKDGGYWEYTPHISSWGTGSTDPNNRGRATNREVEQKKIIPTKSVLDYQIF